jgi:AhpD family alkylhydroperoxidase
MTAVTEVEWGECLVAPVRDAALERESRKAYGVPYPVVQYFARCPWLARGLIDGRLRSGLLAHLDPDLADLIFLAVSEDNSCRYCYVSQRAQLRILGFDDQKIRAIEQASYRSQFEPRERLVLDYARRISRSNPAPSASDQQALVDAGYSIEAVREATFAAANAVLANRLTTLLAIPLAPVEGIEDRLSTRLLRPLIARAMRSVNRPGRPEMLADEHKTGPFAYVGRALDGLPVATLRGRNMAMAWESPTLPQRTKALVFAVVARGLGSERMEREAAEVLAANGLDEAGTADVLAHLGSAALGPIEAAIVPFARETIRYRPEDIQRRTREMAALLSDEELLELVGFVALANATGRLSLVLCER